MTIVLQIDDSGPLKRQIIEDAYSYCGITGYEFGLSAEEVAKGLSLLEAMMREFPWSALGYNHASYGVGEPTEFSNIPFDALSAVSLSLAARIAPTKGKTLSPDQKAEMSRSRALLSSQYATVEPMPFARNTPRGAGASPLHVGNFIHETVDDD